MNLTEITKEVSTNIHVSPALVKKIIQDMVRVVTNSLTQGDTVTIPNLGVLTVQHKEERKGRNPLTGEAMIISAKYVPKFRISETIKKAVNV